MAIAGPVLDLLIHPFQNPNPGIWAACASGLYYSHDLAKTWQYAYESLLGDSQLPASALALAPTTPGSWLLLSGGPGGVLRSEDHGGTWKIFRLPGPVPVITALAVSPAFAQDGTAFAATEQDGVFVTYNYGSSWTSWNFGLLDVQAFTLAVSPQYPTDRQVFVGVSTGLFRSQNRGRSWQPIELPGGYDAVLSLALSPAFGQDGLGFTGTESSGLLRTEDGGSTWKSCTHELPEGAINRIALDPDYPARPALVALVEDQLFISRDQGSHWDAWRIPGLPQDFEITVFTAPKGFEAGSPVCLGDSLGRVLYLSAP
jgi:photosystem II stability/assembly factor-like uncharacterized protein